MKLKKLMAAVLAAVMAAGILSGCVGGAGGSGSSTLSLNNSTLNSLLDGVDSEIQVTPLEKLDTTLETVTSEISVSENIGTRVYINTQVGAEMGWFLVNGKQGLTVVVSDEKLSKGLLMEDIVDILTKMQIKVGNVEEVDQLGKIDTPEKLSAALILFADSLYGSVSVLDSEYAASACKVEAKNGTIYWVVAVQVTNSWA